MEGRRVLKKLPPKRVVQALSYLFFFLCVCVFLSFIQLLCSLIYDAPVTYSQTFVIIYFHGNNARWPCHRRSAKAVGSSPPIDSQALFHDLTLFNLEGHNEPAEVREWPPL